MQLDWLKKFVSFVTLLVVPTPEPIDNSTAMGRFQFVNQELGKINAEALVQAKAAEASSSTTTTMATTTAILLDETFPNHTLFTNSSDSIATANPSPDMTTTTSCYYTRTQWKKPCGNKPPSSPPKYTEGSIVPVLKFFLDNASELDEQLGELKKIVLLVHNNYTIQKTNQTSYASLKKRAEDASTRVCIDDDNTPLIKIFYDLESKLLNDVGKALTDVEQMYENYDHGTINADTERKLKDKIGNISYNGMHLLCKFDGWKEDYFPTSTTVDPDRRRQQEDVAAGPCEQLDVSAMSETQRMDVMASRVVTILEELSDFGCMLSNGLRISKRLHEEMMKTTAMPDDSSSSSSSSSSN